MTKRVTILIFASLVLVSFMLTAAPQHQKMMKHAKFGIRMAEKNLFPAKFLLRVKDEVGLSESQVAKIEKMSLLQTETFVRNRADIKIKELQFAAFLKKDPVSRSKMEKMIRDIAKMKTDMHLQRLNHLLDIKALLSPEQLQKIEALKKERRKKRMKRGKKGKKRSGQKGERRSKRGGQYQAQCEFQSQQQVSEAPQKSQSSL